MNDESELLYRQLHSPDPHTRDHATERLWQLYFGAAGPEAEIRLLQAEQAVESGMYDAAEERLTDLIMDFPHFAEAWNRRATMYYLAKNYVASLADCEATTRLEPNHFGAWHGMGLNYLALKRYDSAARAFKRALAIQPFAETNQKLLAQCLTKLN
jgi:tetratricopeptide (TPR) repeat protein